MAFAEEPVAASPVRVIKQAAPDKALIFEVMVRAGARRRVATPHDLHRRFVDGPIDAREWGLPPSDKK